MKVTSAEVGVKAEGLDDGTFKESVYYQHVLQAWHRTIGHIPRGVPHLGLDILVLETPVGLAWLSEEGSVREGRGSEDLASPLGSSLEGLDTK